MGLFQTERCSLQITCKKTGNSQLDIIRKNDFLIHIKGHRWGSVLVSPIMRFSNTSYHHRPVVFVYGKALKPIVSSLAQEKIDSSGAERCRRELKTRKGLRPIEQSVEDMSEAPLWISQRSLSNRASLPPFPLCCSHSILATPSALQSSSHVTSDEMSFRNFLHLWLFTTHFTSQGASWAESATFGWIYRAWNVSA